MINKYAKGGKSNAASQEQLVQLFQAAAENAQVDPQELVQKASEIGQDEQAAAQFMQGLQLCAQGDPEGIKFIKSLFQSPAFRQGGKIWDFVCKHRKGGYVAGCRCKQEGGRVNPPSFKHTGEYSVQDSNNPNQWNVVAHGYDVNGEPIAVPTGQGGFWMGNEKGAGYNNGVKRYSPEQMANWLKFYDESLPNANRVQGPEDRLAGMESGGKIRKGKIGVPEMPPVYELAQARKSKEYKKGLPVSERSQNRGGGGDITDYGELIKDENGLKYRDVRQTDWNSVFGKLSQDFYREYVPNNRYKRLRKQGWTPANYTQEQRDSLTTTFNKNFGDLGAIKQNDRGYDYWEVDDDVINRYYPWFNRNNE